ncbi:MAG: DUF3347 domain-containing protein [Chitinophagaceae bacterium]
MIPTIIKLVFILFVNLAGGQEVQDSILGKYLEIKEDLVMEDSKLASLHSGQLLVLLDDHHDPMSGLVKTAKKLEAAKGLAEQREVFAEISPMIWELLQQVDYSGRTIYYQYCPMKKAYWLSTEAKIRNPYYGAKMLNCGSQKEKLN